MADILSAQAGERVSPTQLIDAAERTLRSLIRSNATQRDAAVDLLAADALVTYAFELAADEPERLDGVATEAMRRLSAHASAPRD
ncbi:MAG: hypothetical protein U0132_11625 [Gemmatimonadaceae bacterium]